MSRSLLLAAALTLTLSACAQTTPVQVVAPGASVPWGCPQTVLRPVLPPDGGFIGPGEVHVVTSDGKHAQIPDGWGLSRETWHRINAYRVALESAHAQCRKALDGINELNRQK